MLVAVVSSLHLYDKSDAGEDSAVEWGAARKIECLLPLLYIPTTSVDVERLRVARCQQGFLAQNPVKNM